jgi:Protein of unknown function (DUF3040)
VLSDRERRILERIELHLVESDPEFARLFATFHHRHGESRVPAFLLVVGLALMVLGSMTVAVPLALAGITLSIFALFSAYTRSSAVRRAGFA